MPAISPLFLLPNTSTVLARSAINLLKSADQAELDEAIQTFVNRNLKAIEVMPLLEQSVNFSEVLEKLSSDWSDQTTRAFAATFSMDAAKKDVMDLMVAIAILNEADLENELRNENTPQATANDLLENRRVTWQYPPAGTVLTPPYVVLVAVEAVDTVKADSDVQSILGELVDYRGFKIARRASTGPLKIDPNLLSEFIKNRTPFSLQPTPAPPAPPASPPSLPGLPGLPGLGGMFGIAPGLGQPSVPQPPPGVPAGSPAGVMSNPLLAIHAATAVSPSILSRVRGGL